MQQNYGTGSGYPGQLGSRVRAGQPGGRLHKDELLEPIDRVLRNTHIYICIYVYNPKWVVARQLFDPMIAVGQGSCSNRCTTSGRQRLAIADRGRQTEDRGQLQGGSREGGLTGAGSGERAEGRETGETEETRQAAHRLQRPDMRLHLGHTGAVILLTPPPLSY